MAGGVCRCWMSRRWVPMAPLNAVAVATLGARTQPTARSLGEQPLSWLALQSGVDELAADFQHQGVEPGCGVAVR